jgi:glucosamine-6-phosphate deaminase
LHDRVRSLTFDALAVRVFDDLAALAHSAANDAAEALRDAIRTRGEANIMLATGNSQLAFLAELVQIRDIAWEQVRAFHMDEYAGISHTHPASFQRYMKKRVAAQLPAMEFHYLNGDTGDAVAEAHRYAELLKQYPLDVCCCGIGENGHLAFNDPPVADFDDHELVKVVPLDFASRNQQVGEGHFQTLDEVPTHAITVTIPALLAAWRLFAIVPEARKARPVHDALCGPITTECPASILRQQPNATLYLDQASAAELTG